MQGTRLARIVVDARNRLRVGEIIAILTPHVAAEAGANVDPAVRIQFGTVLLSAHAELNAMQKDPETSAVLHQLGIPRFFETATIGRLLGVMETARDSTSLRGHADFRLFRNFLAEIEAFGNLANALQTFLIDQRFRRYDQDDGLVEIAILSSDAEPITVDHLSVVLRTVRELHDLIARAIGAPDSTARVAVIDSGSDVLLALKAKAEAAKTIGTLLVQWWDWFKYRDLHDFDRKMDSMFKGLGVIAELDKMTATPGPDAEGARVMRQQIFDRLKVLTGLGVKISQPETVETDRLQLEAKRDTKLLRNPESRYQANELSDETD